MVEPRLGILLLYIFQALTGSSDKLGEAALSCDRAVHAAKRTLKTRKPPRHLMDNACYSSNINQAC
ncbi:hypothetical protein [Scytonema sp. NUACC21]